MGWGFIVNSASLSHDCDVANSLVQEDIAQRLTPCVVAYILPCMMHPRIILDTNVLVAGLRSRRGASFRLLELVGKGTFDIHLSVPLVLEYEDVLNRFLGELHVSRSAVDAIIDFHCAVGKQHEIFFLWRPFLRDPKDDMVLELAVRAECEYIITHNIKDFRGVAEFNLQALTPGEFLVARGLI